MCRRRKRAKERSIRKTHVLPIAHVLLEATWSELARQEVLCQEMGRAVDHDNAGAEEDLGQLVTGMDWLIAGL